MDLGKFGIGAFLSSSLVELSFPGKLATLLGLILLLWGLVSSLTSFVLFGIALLFLALTGYYWGHRYVCANFKERNSKSVGQTFFEALGFF
jgi:hypothetical protein